MNLRQYSIIFVLLSFVSCNTSSTTKNNTNENISKTNYIPTGKMFTVEVPVTLVPKGSVPAHLNGKVPFVVNEPPASKPEAPMVIMASHDGCEIWIIRAVKIPESIKLTPTKKKLILKTHIEKIKSAMNDREGKKIDINEIVEIEINEKMGMLFNMKELNLSKCVKIANVVSGTRKGDVYNTIFVFEFKQRMFEITYINHGTIFLQIVQSDSEKWNKIQSYLDKLISTIR